MIDSRAFQFGKLTITPLDTPGHCAGHISLLVEGGELRYFIGGDLVFYGGTIVAQNIHDCSIQEYSASVARMVQEVEFDSLLPGHYTISMRDGKRHLEKAHQIFCQLGYSAERALSAQPFSSPSWIKASRICSFARATCASAPSLVLSVSSDHLTGDIHERAK